MKHSFTLPQFTGTALEIEISRWTGKSRLWKDGIELERSCERGKPEGRLFLLNLRDSINVTFKKMINELIK